MRLDHFGGQGKVGLHRHGNLAHNSVRHLGRLLIRVVTRTRNNNLVTGVKQRQGNDEHTLLPAGRHHNFVIRVIGSAVVADIVGNGGAQRFDSQGVRVMRRAVRQGLLPRFDDMGGRVEVRIAAAKFDHIVYAIGNIEHLGNQPAIGQFHAFSKPWV